MSRLGDTYYEDSGSGDVAVIFLHYFGSAGGAWQPLVAALNENVRCVVPDLRGFGKSPASGTEFSIADYADDVARLVDALALKKYVFAGHSMGGKIALALAARRSAGLQSLVLFAPSPPTPEPMDDDARDELRRMYGDRNKIETHLKKLCAQSLAEDILRRESSQHLAASAAAWNTWIDSGSREDISGNISAINVPVLVIGGEKDGSMTPDLLQREVVAPLSKASLKILSETGHLLPLEQPVEIATMLNCWLAITKK